VRWRLVARPMPFAPPVTTTEPRMLPPCLERNGT
jgi:hypothetical protein